MSLPGRERIPEIQRIKDMYVGKRNPSSHILETNIFVSLSLSLSHVHAPANRTQRPKALLYFLLPVLGAGEDPDSIAIKILQGGSAGN